MSEPGKKVEKMYSVIMSRELWNECYNDHPRPWLIEFLLRHGANPNFVLEDDESKWNCLICLLPGGCTEDERDCVKILLKNGADVNMPDYKGSTPLMFCATNGDWRTMKLLLQCGADVNAVDDKGNTALFYAEDLECLKLLHKSGAILDHVNLNCRTAFVSWMYCGRDNTEKILYLIENGVDVNFKFNFDEDKNQNVTVMDCLERNLFWFPKEIQEAIQRVLTS